MFFWFFKTEHKNKQTNQIFSWRPIFEAAQWTQSWAQLGRLCCDTPDTNWSLEHEWNEWQFVDHFVSNCKAPSRWTTVARLRSPEHKTCLIHCLSFWHSETGQCSTPRTNRKDTSSYVGETEQNKRPNFSCAFSLVFQATDLHHWQLEKIQTTTSTMLGDGTRDNGVTPTNQTLDTVDTKIHCQKFADLQTHSIWQVKNRRVSGSWYATTDNIFAFPKESVSKTS